jgi:NAD(P)-dependent dehydrogenase (short-subunit alcohol dehydrogenase family)
MAGGGRDREIITKEFQTAHPQVAVVSGGSLGMGKAFVAALRSRDYAVVTCARDPAKLKQLEAEYPGVECHAVDVSDAFAVQNGTKKSTVPRVGSAARPVMRRFAAGQMRGERPGATRIWRVPNALNGRQQSEPRGRHMGVAALRHG